MLYKVQSYFKPTKDKDNIKLIIFSADCTKQKAADFAMKREIFFLMSFCQMHTWQLQFLQNCGFLRSVATLTRIWIRLIDSHTQAGYATLCLLFYISTHHSSFYTFISTNATIDAILRAFGVNISFFFLIHNQIKIV